MALELNFRMVKAIARKEFMDNVRNRWIIAVTAIFVVMTLVISFVFGGGQFGGLQITVIGILTLSGFLVPIIAIMLGYNTITGEAETGSLSVMLACPISRLDVLLGKFLGLAAVLTVTTMCGFGIAGLVIMGSGASDAPAYLAFIMLTLMLGLMYLSVSMCFSALLRRNVAALGAGIGLFFWGSIFGSVVVGIHLAAGGTFEQMGISMPDWMWVAMMVLSPTDMFQTSAMLAFGIRQFEIMGMPITIPAYIDMFRLLAIYLAWILIPLAISHHAFRRRDL